MSKKKQAAKVAAPAVSTTETAKVDNTTTATTKEKGNAEATQQVAAPAATEKEKATTSPKKEEKQQTQTKTDKQTAQKDTAQQQKSKKEKIPTVIAEDASEEAMRTLTKSVGTSISSSSSSTDAKAMLAFVGHQRFTNNEDLKKNFPEQYNAINQAINAVWFLGMIGVQQEMMGMQAEGKLQLVVSPEQVMPLQEMANMFGVKLAAPKALPGSVDGQLAIPFSAQETIIPEELKDPKLAKKLEVPELDIEKVGSDHEMICSALEYLLRKNRNLVISLIETVEWYQKLCINNESSADTKLALNNREINEWIDEIFHLVPVNGLLKGLGRSVYLYTKNEGSPVSAHCLLHGQLPNCPEDDVVRILRVLVQENFRYNLEEKIDAKGNVLKTEKVENPTDDKAVQASIGVLGVEYVNTLMSDYSASVPEGATEEQLEEIKEKRNRARKILSLVRANYYPGKVEPTTEQLRFAVGKIINCYRSPMEQIAEFEGPLPVLVGEYPKTEAVVTSTEKKN